MDFKSKTSIRVAALEKKARQYFEDYGYELIHIEHNGLGGYIVVKDEDGIRYEMGYDTAMSHVLTPSEKQEMEEDLFICKEQEL